MRNIKDKNFSREKKCGGKDRNKVPRVRWRKNSNNEFIPKQGRIRGIREAKQ